MANGKSVRGKNKVWRILSGKYKKRLTLKQRVERLVQAIQQQLEWDSTDVKTFKLLQKGKIDWSGDARGKRRTRKHIRKRR